MQAEAAACVAQFIPANTGLRRAVADTHCVVGDQRCVAAKVAVGESIHETVAVRIDSLRRACLRDAVSGRIGKFGSSFSARLAESGDVNICWAGERRLRWSSPVHMKFS